MLEECVMSWTAWDPGKVENWFVVSLNLKHWSRQYVVERSACAVPPPWPQQLRAGLCRHRTVPGARREMLGGQLMGPLCLCCSLLNPSPTLMVTAQFRKWGHEFLLEEEFLLPYWPWAPVQKVAAGENHWGGALWNSSAVLGESFHNRIFPPFGVHKLLDTAQSSHKTSFCWKHSREVSIFFYFSFQSLCHCSLHTLRNRVMLNVKLICFKRFSIFECKMESAEIRPLICVIT